MNVKQLQEVLRVSITQGSTLGLPVVDLTEVELETRDIPISLPKVVWEMLDKFDFSVLKTEASTVRLFEDVIVTSLLNSPQAIMVMSLKGEPND